MKELRISITDDIYHDLEMGRNDDVAALFKCAIDVVLQGGKVIIEQRCSNAPSKIVAEYSTEQEVIDWKNRLNDMQSKLKREPIDC